MTPPSTLTIYRDHWARGEKKGRARHRKQPTSLLNEKGMCCLGFLARAMGFPTEKLYDSATPVDATREAISPLTEQSSYPKSQRDTDWATQAAEFNDLDQYFDDDLGEWVDPRDLESYRERLLREHFTHVGIRLRFVNKAPEGWRKRWQEELRHVKRAGLVTVVKAD